VAALVDELLERSDAFRAVWTQHDVRLPSAGRHRFRHPDVGPLELDFESASLRADPGLTLLLATADPASPSAAALEALATTLGEPAAGIGPMGSSARRARTRRGPRPRSAPS
jgi:hypothetical protein